MPASLDEYKASYGGMRATQRNIDSLRAIDRLEQTAVKADFLTKNPQWDMFLSYIQTAIDEYAADRDWVIGKLGEYEMVGYEPIMRLKARLNKLEATITALQSVLSLPKELIEIGHKATDLRTKINASEKKDGGRKD